MYRKTIFKKNILHNPSPENFKKYKALVDTITDSKPESNLVLNPFSSQVVRLLKIHDNLDQILDQRIKYGLEESNEMESELYLQISKLSNDVLKLALKYSEVKVKL